MAVKNSNIIRFNPTYGQQEAKQPITATPDELKLFDETKTAFTNNAGSQGYTMKTAERSLAIVTDFVSHSGKLPWHCDEVDFEAWAAHLGRERQLAISSQRLYQTAIHDYFAYLIGRARFSHAIQLIRGSALHQIVTDENRLVHRLDREISKERPAMSFEEVQQLFASLDAEIERSAQAHGKDLLPLLRDRAHFFLIYSGAFRAGETLGLSIRSFVPNPNLPELGNFGYSSVMRKGSKGSGKKHQMVPTTNPAFGEMLAWYKEQIRPHLALKLKDPNDDTFFLSERGTKMGYSNLDYRFKLALKRAGLADKGYTLHSLRHTCATHEALTLSLEALRIKLGHKNLSTTQRYLHIPDQFVAREIEQAVAARIERAINEVGKKAARAAKAEYESRMASSIDAARLDLPPATLHPNPGATEVYGGDLR